MTAKELINFLQKHVDLNPHMAETPILDGVTYSEINGLGFGSNGMSLSVDFRGFKHNEYSAWANFENVFNQAGIEVLNHWEIPNEYWPDSYVDTKASNPWWLVQTNAGMIKIGWRKRVIEITWVDTPIRVVVTQDEVTKSDTMVHAWGEEDAIKYLKELNQYFPGNGTPNTTVARSLIEIAERTQKELTAIAEFAEKYLSDEWKKQ